METDDSKLYHRENLLRLTKGNETAADWIAMGRVYIHLLDDIIDEDLAPNGDRKQGIQRVLRLAAMALELYSHPWFRQNALLLSSVMLIANVNFADSVDWEQATEDWKRQWSDWSRHGWLDAVLLTAYLCGGYEHMASMSKAVRQIAWEQHHDETGKVV